MLTLHMVSLEKNNLLFVFIFLLLFFFIICLLTMCRALSIQNEKADIIHRIPLTSFTINNSS